MATGTIKRVMRDREFGFIGAEDGTEIFFHRSVLADIDIEQLSEGQRVEFELEEGERGPKASRVRMADRGLRVSPGSYVEQERVGEGKQPDSRSRLLITRHGMEPKQLIERGPAGDGRSQGH